MDNLGNTESDALDFKLSDRTGALVRCSPRAKQEVERLSKAYGLSQSKVAEISFRLADDHILRRNYTNLPQLADEVADLERRSALLLGQAEQLESICRMLVATAD
jgi:hypothetical protein